MPIPFLLTGLGVTAGIIGAGGHIAAKETNEKAQELYDEAENLYNGAKISLEQAQSQTESSLLNLGYSKKNVLDSSIKQFLQVYDRIKHVEISESVGLNEIYKFNINNQEVLQLRKMSDIYQSALSNSATGAVTGAVIALAASGSLPIMTGTLSIAGTALMAGEVGVAAGLAGSALSFGAAMTPLTAIAAPVLLFTGISSSIKADENLEKARTMYAEAEAAVEKMKISEVMCIAISDRADMLNELLEELNVMFCECTILLDNIIRKKTGIFKGKKININKLTEEEIKLIAVTRSLAGAVKSVIDTPILSKEGSLSDDIENIYNNTTNRLQDFRNEVKEVKSYDYSVNVISQKQKIENNNGSEKTSTSSILNAVRNLIVFMLASISAIINGTLIGWFTVFPIIILLFMNTRTTSNFFKFIKNISKFMIGIDFCLLLYIICQVTSDMWTFIIFDIVLGAIFFVLFGASIENKGNSCGNLRKLTQNIFSCLFFTTVAIVVFSILYGLIGFSFNISIIITEILFIPFAYICLFLL